MIEIAFILALSALIVVFVRPVFDFLWAFGKDALERRFSEKIDD